MSPARKGRATRLTRFCGVLVLLEDRGASNADRAGCLVRSRVSNDGCWAAMRARIRSATATTSAMLAGDLRIAPFADGVEKIALALRPGLFAGDSLRSSVMSSSKTTFLAARLQRRATLHAALTADDLRIRAADRGRAIGKVDAESGSCRSRLPFCARRLRSRGWRAAPRRSRCRMSAAHEPDLRADQTRSGHRLDRLHARVGNAHRQVKSCTIRSKHDADVRRTE